MGVFAIDGDASCSLHHAKFTHSVPLNEGGDLVYNSANSHLLSKLSRLARIAA